MPSSPRFLVLFHRATEKTVLWHFPCVRRVASQAIVALHQLVNVTGVEATDQFQQNMSKFGVKIEVVMRSLVFWANMSCLKSKCLYHLDFLQISKTDGRSHRFVVFATKYKLPQPSISPSGHWPNLETSTFVLLHGANTSWKSLQKPRWRGCITSHLTTDINC